MVSGVARKDPTHVIPKVNLCMHTVFQVCHSKGLYGQSTIFGTYMDTEMGVVIHMYLKHCRDYIDSKYIWVHGLNSLGSSVFADIPFLAFLAIHRKRKRCGQVGPSPCYSQSEVVCAYQVLDL